jgi:hypothetical protein
VTKTEEFFDRYEEGANSFDPDLMASLYTAEFMAGDPNGVMCGRNDMALRDSFIRRKEFFQQIGFKRAKVLDVNATLLRWGSGFDGWDVGARRQSPWRLSQLRQCARSLLAIRCNRYACMLCQVPCATGCNRPRRRCRYGCNRPQGPQTESVPVA